MLKTSVFFIERSILNVLGLKRGEPVKKIIKHITPLFLVGILFVNHCVLYGQEPIEKQQINKPIYMAVIIDDFGNQMAGTDAIAQLPIPLTGAVIPGMPFAKEDAKKLHDAGKEVILHVPLEGFNSKPGWLGPKGITTGMPPNKIKQILEESLVEVPYAVGMNNHMGSRAMQNKTIVDTLISFAKEKGLYFVDSKTYDITVAQNIAQEKAITYLVRDVFLDNTPSTQHVIKQLQEALQIGKQKGYVIVIGHVGPEKGPHTAAALKAMIPKLQAENVEFVTIGTLKDCLHGQ